MANTYIVHSANPIESFPFLGSWETEGVGYGVTGISDISNQGSISSNTDLDGFNIWAIGGIQSGFGYSDACTAHPQICIVMEPGADQDLFTNVSIQLDTANSPTIFESADANLFTQSPTLGTESSNWVWTVANASLYFVNGHNTTVIFGVTAPLVNCINLTVTVMSATQIDLSWTHDGADAVFFNVSRDDVVIAQLANTVFDYEDTGLTPETTYSYSITPVDGSNNAVCLSGGGGGTTMATQDVSFLSAFNGDQFYTANGVLNIGGTLYTYMEGTLTPVTTYTDVTGSVENPNPIVVNTDGYLDTEIWAAAGTNTRVQIYDVNGVLQQDLDNIPGVPFVPDLTQVFVIDSIFATDTANAASANAVNWVYKVANAAYAQANTDANAISNLISNVAQLSTNTVIIQSGGATINVGNSINFINTAFANIAVTVAGSDRVNVAVFANGTTTGNTTSNSSITINGFILQWAFYQHTASGEAGPFTDDFPAAFPNECLSIQMTTQGGPGAAGLVVSSFTRSAFTWYTQFAGAGTTGQYVFAIGH